MTGPQGSMRALSLVAVGIRRWAPFAWAFLAAVLMTWLLVRIAPGKGWVSDPRPDRWSHRVVAMFGGVPILVAFLTATLFLPHDRQVQALVVMTLAVGLLGLVDDIVGLTPKAKFLAPALAAVYAVYSGFIYRITGNFWIDATITILWIAVMTNAFNLIDNMDGLAAGVAIIALAQIILLAGPDLPTSQAALCLLAAVAGFLLFNLNPARIFMGDVGSLAIGFFLTCISVQATDHRSGLTSMILMPVLILFIPFFDTLLVSVTRSLRGKPISQGGRDHTSHRLVIIGLNERQAVLLLHAIAIVAGLLAFWWKSSPAALGAVMVGLFLVGTALFWLYLASLWLPPPA